MNFGKRYLNWNDTKFYKNNVALVNDIYNVFITGSDQVFNPYGSNYDKNYFLDFVKDKNKCFSYAASFGLSYKNLTDKEKLFIKQNLKNFKILSLREKQGVDIVNKLSDVKTEVHIDPTLILNKQDWLKISKIPKEDKFILVYLMNGEKRTIEFARKLSKKEKLKLKIVTTSLKNYILEKNTCVVSPQEWLGYMLKAKYIVTNSFHGLCFSINFNKQFFVDFLPQNFSVNSRLENLLDLTSLRERLVDNIKTDYDKTINWNNVNKIIEKERQKSINYLKKIIE